MRSVSVRLDDLRTMILNLGFVGENEHTRVLIDAKKMYDQYPTASASLTVQPPEGDAYPAVIERDGDFVVWDIVDSNLTEEGNGELQLAFTVGEVVAKTYIGRFRVCRSIIPTGEIPDPLDDFLTRAGAALTAIPETIQDTFGEISAEAETLPAGSSATAAFDSENMKLSFGIPAGEKGDPGDPGDDGFSPIASVSKSGDTATISITDKNGTTTAEITDGQDGQPGDDGYSPTAIVTKTGSVATITLIDKNGTTSAQISDGTPGDPTQLIDDTAGEGDTDKVWSADKMAGEVSTLNSAINGKAPIILDTASGSIATFPDGADGMPVADCVVQIEPVQDLHGQSSPYPAGGGSNIWDEEWELGTINSNTGASMSSDTKIRSKNFIKCTPETEYRYVNASYGGIVFFYSSNNESTFLSSTGNLGKNDTFTTPASCNYIKFTPLTTYGTTYNNDISIAYPSSVTTYSPYANICPISGWTGCNVTIAPTDDPDDPDKVVKSVSWQTEAGTVYGGELDVTTGVLTADRVSVLLNSLEWTKEVSNPRFKSVSLQSLIKLPVTTGERIIVINSDTYLPSNTVFSAPTSDSTDNVTAVYSDGTLYVVDKTYYESDADAFVFARGSVQFVYELATPVTYQLTPIEIRTLLGQNNIFADTGDTAVEYPADTKKYVSGYYTKPSSGIPKTDLASAVQTSLGKADTAYQKPSGGIPLTDLASNVQTVSGTTPSITAKSGITYKCGEVSTLSVTLPASGDVEIIFSSGNTATVLTLTPPSGVTAIKWAGGFDPTSLDADTVYDMIITDGEYGMVASWA